MYYWCTHVINIHTFIPCYVFKQYSAAPVWPGIPETAYNFHSTTRLYAIPPNKPRIHPSLSFSHTTNCTLICFDIHVDIASSSFAKLIARPENKHRSSGEHLSTTTVCLGSINQSNQERFPYGDISEYDMSSCSESCWRVYRSLIDLRSSTETTCESKPGHDQLHRYSTRRSHSLDTQINT